MKKLLTMVLGLLFSGSVSSAAVLKSCEFVTIHLCVESADVDLSDDCEAQSGGEIGTVCPTAHRIGSCEITMREKTVMARYYEGFRGNAEYHCKSNGWIYTAG